MSLVVTKLDFPSSNLLIRPTEPRPKHDGVNPTVEVGVVQYKPHFGHHISISNQYVEIGGKSRVVIGANCSCGATWTNRCGDSFSAIGVGDQELRKLAIFGVWLD